MSDAAELLEPVAEVARVAGRAALARFRTGMDVEWKEDGSPVTVADRSAEQAARDWITRRFPDDGILGEEAGAEKTDARRRWIIDPIDGTQAFIRGVPLWGTLVAVAEGEDVLAGAAFFPVLDELVCAAVGEGCLWNGKRASVSRTADLSDATVLTSDARFAGKENGIAAWSRLVGRAKVARTWGDCYGYLLVATGRADVMIDAVVSPWDAAALMPIVSEAGGVITDWSGRATAFGGSLVATNAHLARDVRKLLQDGGGA